MLSAVAPASSSPAAAASSSSSTARAKRPRVKAELDNQEAPVAGGAPTPSRVKGKKVKVEGEDTTSTVKKEEDNGSFSDAKPVATKKRRTKKEIEEENEVFPPRPSSVQTLSNETQDRKDRRGSGLFIGAHISSAGGVENAPLNALRIGGNAFSCFVRPKMQWASNPIPDTSAQHFKQRVIQHSYIPTPFGIKKEEEIHPNVSSGSSVSDEYGYVVPHGCYLVNLANPDEAKREKSFEAFIDDLQRCEQLGIRLFNFHPGSMTAASATGDEPPPDVGPLTATRAAKADACALVASYINRAHSLTSSVIILIENMAGIRSEDT
ncbi:hypothetical protein NDA16_001268 [Ustilago loliicola]|nr:hypothetical protein NDA16_001268 [Ustilago loliicola]